MPTKFATFDLEIAKGFPDNGNWKSVAPLGITCAALGVSDADEPRYFQDAPQMSREASQELVRELQRVINDGYTLVTWNGTAFDFAVLAQESDMPRECADIALAHVDLMVIVTFKCGHYLGLQKALTGMGLAGKLKEVLLNDGTRLHEMHGSRAPELWAQGEYNAVLSYLREDVMPLLQLTNMVYRTKQLRWISNKGNLRALTVPKLWSVRECFAFSLPDTAWMTTEPPQREKFIEWMPPLDTIIPKAAFAPRDLRELPLFAYASEDAYWREFRHALGQNKS
jgi:hypothetical protein